MELYYLESPHIVYSKMLAIDERLFEMVKPFIHSAFTREGIAMLNRYLKAEHDAIIKIGLSTIPALISDLNYQKDIFGNEYECGFSVGNFLLHFRKIIQYVDGDYKF